MKRVIYLLNEALRGLGNNRGSTVIGIITTAFTIASFGVFLLLYQNVRTIVGSLHDHIQVIVYLEDSITQQEHTRLEKNLKKEATIEKLDFISKKQAREDFHEQFPEESYLLDGIGDNPLPASFVATIASHPQASDRVSGLALRAKDLPGVAHVRYSRDWIERLTLFTSYLEMAAIGIGIILSLASITIISNTIRLAFYARREEIEILRLIGATGTFIAIPYLIEGAVLGALGGGLSIGLLRGGFEIFQDKMSGLNWIGSLHAALEFFPWSISLLLIFAGLLLGCAGSALSVYSWMRLRL